MNRCVCRSTADISQFGLIDVRMFLRTIAVLDGKCDGPHHAQQRKRVEHPAPAVSRHDGNGDKRRRGDGDPAEAMRDPLNETAFLDRKSTRLNSSHLVISYAV